MKRMMSLNVVACLFVLLTWTDWVALSWSQPPMTSDASKIVQASLVDRNGDHISDFLESKVIAGTVRRPGQLTPSPEVTQAVEGRGAGLTASLIVALDHAPTADDVAAFGAKGARVVRQWSDLVYAVAVEYPLATGTLADLEPLTSMPGVVLIEEDAIMQAQVYFATRQTRARQVWRRYGVLGNPDHRIAVMDVGVDASHADLRNPDGRSRVVAFTDTITGTMSPNDTNGHGTIVTGIIASNGHNLGGTEDAEPTIHLVPITVFPGEPAGAGFTTSDYFSPSPRPLGFPVNTSAGPATIVAQMVWQNTTPGFTNTLILVDNDGRVIAEESRASDGRQPLVVVAPLPAGVVSLASGALVQSQFSAGGFTNSPANNTPYWVQVFTPLTSPGDGFNLLSGMAPAVSVVGVKVLDDAGNPAGGSGTLASLLDGMTFINDHRDDLNIVAVNASLGFGGVVAAADTTVNNLVGNGIVFVAAAGNGRNLDPPSALASPASARRAIGVAAVNANDRIASYSSFGAASTSQLKPDVSAPSMSDFGRQMLSLDTNDVDESINREAGFDGPFQPRVFQENTPDRFPNDYGLTAEGTSFSSPVVAGLVGLVADALGDDYARDLNTALFIKSVILMTASETHAPAELGPDPTLDRGGKDPSEGYGRVNADAAVELIREEHSIGHTELSAFGDGVFDRKAFARHVSLEAGQEYTFSLIVPDDADYDLYLYRYGKDGGFLIGSAFSEGDPILLAHSTAPAPGGVEQFNFIPAEDMTAALIAKRVSGSGPLALQSSVRPASDQESPVVNISAPGDGAVFTPGEPFEITWTSSDNVSVASHDLLFSTDGSDMFVVTIAQDLPGDAQRFTWNVPPNLVTEGGRIRIIARDEAGNAGLADAPSAPDLIVTNVTVTPAMAAPGDRVRVQATIVNQGAVPARETTHRLLISSDPVIDLTDRGLSFVRGDALGPGASVPISADVRIPRGINPGVNYVGVIADFANQVRERNEINNTASTPIAITGGG